MTSTGTRSDEACAVLHRYLGDAIDLVAIVGAELADHPGDRKLNQAMTRAIIDLDRIARAHGLVCGLVHPCKCARDDSEDG